MGRMIVVSQHLPHYRKDVYRALEATEGWEVHFAAGFSSRDPGIATMSPEELQNVHPLRNIWIGPFLWQRGLMRLLSEPWDRAILLGDVAHITTWLAAARRLLRKEPTAFWTIGWHRPESGLRRTIRLAFYSLANQLLLYGTDGRRLGIAAGYPEARMTIVGNSSSAAPSNLEESETRLAEIDRALLSVQSPAVGAVIRLTNAKQLDLLIDAAALLEKEGFPRISVVLAGDGPAGELLREHASARGVHLHLLGPIYGERALKRFYDECLLTVVPTRAGLTTIQSLRYGRPVITHDDPAEQMPEFQAIVPGASGDLYAKGNVSDLARLMALWVERVQRQPSEVATACRAAVEDGWTPNASARLIVKALRLDGPSIATTLPSPNKGGAG